MLKRMERWAGVAAFLLGVGSGCAAGAQAPVERPRITGISHVAFFVSDLPKAMGFWRDFLGYEESYSLPKPGSAETRIAFLKINDHQHVELFTDEPPTARNWISHVCFAVDDLQQMRGFLRGNGYDVPAANGAKTKAGDYAFEIRDPNGMLIEFVESQKDGFEAKAAGQFLAASRISGSIYHVGYMVGDAEKTEAFYKMLGFTETWRNGPDPKEIAWINMKVPDGTDYVELMLSHGLPEPGTWGSKNHLSLAVPSIDDAVTKLRQRQTMTGYGKELTMRTGVNGKRQVNLFDPDGTRVELMEPFTASGKPVPSSAGETPAPTAGQFH